MFSVGQARRLRGAAGDPLPTVFQAFEQKKITLRRGQLGLFVAGPGTGKSALGLTYAVKSGESGVYISPDSDAFTQVQRAWSIATNRSMDEGAAFALGKSNEDLELVSQLPLRFNFEASPSLKDIERTVYGYEELFGEFPHLIFIDNITNVRSGIQDNDDDPFSGLEGLLDYLHTMARTTQACVIGMHHVNGPYNDGDKPIPLSGVKGQIGRVPEMILTIFKSGPGRIGVSVVKNRGSFADASGETFAELVFDGDTMTIADPEIDPEPYFPVPEAQSTQDEAQTVSVDLGPSDDELEF